MVLIAAGDGVAADERQLREVEPLVDVVEARPSVRPARLHTVTLWQSKRVRAEATTGLYELGQAHHVGRPRHCQRLSSSWCRTGRGGCQRLLPTRAEPAVPAMLRPCTVKC